MDVGSSSNSPNVSQSFCISAAAPPIPHTLQPTDLAKSKFFSNPLISSSCVAFPALRHACKLSFPCFFLRIRRLRLRSRVMMALMRMSLLGLSNLQPSTLSQSSPPRLVSVLAQQSVVAKPSLETSKRMVIRAAGAGNDESATEVDLSVFRFTLGIPGFDDGDLPRLVGILFGSLLLVNHVVSIESMTSAQLTSEALGLFLAAVAVSLPSVGRRLKGGEATKEGNKAPVHRSVFELAHSLSDKQKQELAWGSFALLQNTKTNTVIVWHRGEVVCARGNLDLGTMVGSGGSKALPLLQNILNDTPFITSSGPLYVSNGADTKGWSIVPKDAKSIFVQPFEGSDSAGKGGLILLSYQPRSYSKKDRTWIAMLAQKFLEALKA